MGVGIHLLVPYPIPFLLLRRASYIVLMYVPEIVHLSAISSKEYPAIDKPISIEITPGVYQEEYAPCHYLTY